MNLPTQGVSMKSRFRELVVFFICFLSAPFSGLVLIIMGGVRSDAFLGLPQPAKKISGCVYGMIILLGGCFFYYNLWVSGMSYLASQEALLLVVTTWFATDFFAREIK